MRLEKRRHLLLVKERGTFEPPQHVLIDAFTPAEAKEKAQHQYPNSNILVLESR